MAIRQPHYVTPEEYLRRERDAEFKSEYLDGVIYAMAGASPRHSQIAANVIGELRPRSRGKGCAAHTSDLKVHTPGDRLFAYADAILVCGQPVVHVSSDHVVTNATVVVEVLSRKTEAFDRGAKWNRYQQISSLRQYILVSQVEPLVEHYQRQDDGSWRYSIASGLDAAVDIPSIDGVIPLAEIYYGVQFGPEDEDEQQ